LSVNPLYSFENALKSAEIKLTEVLGKCCHILVKRRLDEGSIREIQRIENKAFRHELRYSVEELISRGQEEDFILLLVLYENEPIAFLHGYNDPSEEFAFFLDTVATVLEGRGIGSLLVILALLYGFEEGYKSVTLRTEEEDEKGRKLKSFYENLGFEVFPCNPSEGLAMRRKLNLQDIQAVLKALK